mgnify:CR=1 FL=1
MANKPIKQTVLNRFVDQVVGDCKKRFDDNASLENLVYYLVQRGIIPTERARNYAIVRDYQKYIIDTSGKKVDFCYAMETEYKLTDTQISNIISKNLPKFFLDKHIDYSID